MYNDPNFFYYNNPVNYANFARNAPKAGLFSSLKRLKWGDILNNTSKCLNVINQAIPIVYQVKPLFNNAKTMLRIANIIKSDEKPRTRNNNYQTSNQGVSYGYEYDNQSVTKKEEKQNNFSSNQPTFFL